MFDCMKELHTSRGQPTIPNELRLCFGVGPLALINLPWADDEITLPNKLAAPGELQPLCYALL